MPELPEVETVRRTLAPALGFRVDDTWSSGLPLRLGRAIDFEAITRAARGAVLEEVRRVGKYLLLDFAGRRASVLVHLGMSGRLRLMDAGEPMARHTHVVFRLRRGRARRELRFSDPRRFGQVDVVPRGEPRAHAALALLGPDPLTEAVDGAHLHACARRTRRAIKLVLLDQTVVAGIGNIYASEALWEARIRPSLPGARLSRPRADALAAAVRVVLDRALDNGGTSLRDFVAADGYAGDHAGYLWVYDRAGQLCVRPQCGGVIRRTVQQGRATFHCPRCQLR